MSQHENDELFDDDIRALLADARVTEPMPADVAARLDDVLEDLRAPLRAAEAPAVVPLRRRMAPRLLAAAAVIAVAGGAGVGLNQMLVSSGSGSDESADAGSPASAEQETTRDSAEPEVVAPQSQPQSATQDQELYGRTVAPPLRSATVQRDVTRLLSNFVTTTTPSQTIEELAGRLDASVAGESPFGALVTEELTQARVIESYAASCPGPAVNDSLTLRVRFDGALAALVVRQPADAAHPVDVWSCDGSKLLAQTTVPLEP